MKIDEMGQQAVAFVSNARAEKQAENQDAHGDSVARQQRATDKVDFSAKIPAASEARQSEEMRASRVDAIKAEVESGTYNVSGRIIAEKILSRIEKATAS